MPDTTPTPAPVPDPALVQRAAEGPTWAALADAINALPPAPPGPHPDGSLRARVADALLARIKLATVQPEPRWPGQIGSILAATEYDLADAVLAELAPELDAARDDKGAGQGAIRTLMRTEREAVKRAEQAEAALADMTRKRDEWQWRADDAQRQNRCQRDRAQQAEAALAEAHATNQRLNYRAQTAESRLNAATVAVAEWQVGENGTYVPLHTLAAIARAVGIHHDTERWELHHQRIAALEESVERVRQLAERWRYIQDRRRAADELHRALTPTADTPKEPTT